MALLLTSLFVFFLSLMIGVRYWLASRQIRYVLAHAEHVPPQFADRVSPEAHRKAALYTVEKTQLRIVETAVGAAALVCLTLLGGLQWISDTLRGLIASDLLYQVAVVAVIALVLGLIDLPFSWIRQFRIEERFGFNRMTPRLWIIDLVKSLIVASSLGLPLLAATIWLMQKAGDAWWIYVWLLWVAFNVLILLLYPTLIAPIFNKFEPLKDSALAERIGALLSRTGFQSKGVFVMDGSRRSAHGNAYFTGLGRAKRIVFFDTLIERLLPPEIEAVLAHELGHFKLKHVAKRLTFSFVASFGVLALLGWLIRQPWFFAGLGFEPAVGQAHQGVALVLFMLVLPVFTFVFAPLTSVMSRKHEFEADRFAARNASASDLVNALVKLYQDNASTLTPDPIHSAFYDSHPPASIRIERLLQAAA
ncbi:MAG TPA: M48 family metallopeptidase [Burkholderiaceae bacterium]|nr:M48 family metallopeptidase [Burkholderiaceae bacterium]